MFMQRVIPFSRNNTAQYMKFDLKSDCYLELIEWANPDIIIHQRCFN